MRFRRMQPELPLQADCVLEPTLRLGEIAEQDRDLTHAVEADRFADLVAALAGHAQRLALHLGRAISSPCDSVMSASAR